MSAASEDRIRTSPSFFAPSFTSRVISCRSSGSFVIWVSSSTVRYAALQQRVVDDLGAGFGRAFGRANVSSSPSTGSTVCSR